MIQKPPPPEHGKIGGEEEKQEKALALSPRQGGHFHPQCGRLRKTGADASPGDRNSG